MEEKVLEAKISVQLIKDCLPKAMSYPQYRNLVAKLAQEKKTTGPLQTDALINYTLLNNSRMNRWDKILKFSDDAVERIAVFNQKITWFVLTESWCGDASPALPVINKIAGLNPNISLLIALRDEHLEIMNRFLTNGAMSIPKLIVIDNATDDIIATWGSRSTKATELAAAYKQEHGQLTARFKQDLQIWYNKDKGQSILKDLLQLLPLK